MTIISIPLSVVLIGIVIYLLGKILQFLFILGYGLLNLGKVREYATTPVFVVDYATNTSIGVYDNVKKFVDECVVCVDEDSYTRPSQFSLDNNVIYKCRLQSNPLKVNYVKFMSEKNYRG